MNQRIKQLRTVLGLTQSEFANRISVTNASVSLIERGERNPSSQTIQLICQQFNVNREWLLTGKGNMLLEYTDRLQIVDAALDGEDERLKDVICGLSRTIGWDKMVDIIFAVDKVVKAFQANPGSLDLLSETLSAITEELQKNTPKP